MELTKNEKELDKISKELGVDQFAPAEPKDDKSLFGINDSNIIEINEKDLTDVDGMEWSKHNPPLDTPTFYLNQKG
jgi:hypothetical protein